ncbi:asparagine--tRNA ligase, mitochondrial-like-like [Oopsacas minuta]|uniref:asparagine--tRNA ligase n=1 Tax=Oopsacas minuta TaxID=111878 RepID=A0AAV7JXW8_9METZ|nr:asparagine--tRNA ligase, mitochondrial-like-like [Oopsacas minuta]
MFNSILKLRKFVFYSATKKGVYYLRFNSGDNLSKYQGWVKNIRKLKSFVFIDLVDSLTPQIFQVVVPKNGFTPEDLRNITPGSSIQVIGTHSNTIGKTNKRDIHPKEIKLIGKCSQDTYPLRHATIYSNDYLRKYLHLRGRTDLFRSMNTLRSETSYAIHTYFQKNRFLLTHPPIITSMDCEGAGDLFRVSQANSEDSFFREVKHLTVSGQFHLEAIACGNSKVYSFGPTFRADKSHTRRHLAEFYMVEAEVAFCDTIQDVTMVTEELCKYVINIVLNKWDSLQQLFTEGNCLDREKREQLKRILQNPFIAISYSDTLDLLDSLNIDIKWGDDLHSEAEHALTSHFNCPIFVTNYPAGLKPFYMLQDDVSNDNRKTVSCFDLLWPGLGELAGGSLREHRVRRLEGAMSAKFNTSPSSESSLDWYLDVRRYGGVPMGGFGLGFERLLQAMTGMDIRDTIPFPRFYKSCNH